MHDKSTQSGPSVYPRGGRPADDRWRSCCVLAANNNIESSKTVQYTMVQQRKTMTMTIASPKQHFRLLLPSITLLLSSVTLVASKKEKNLQDLVYREFPRRTEAEAAVMEWGHSAVIR